MRAKIRGIYTTALTSLLLKQGLTIVQPTQPIQERFSLPSLQLPEEVYIHDLPDKQGVIVEGLRVEEMGELLKTLLPEAIFRPSATIPKLDQLSGIKLSWEQFRRLSHRYEVEFPYQVKVELDKIRATVTPTIQGHHLLKIIDAASVDMAEAELRDHPERVEELGRGLREKLIYQCYHKGDSFIVQHIKLDGSVVTVRGIIEEVEPGRVVLRRGFRGGGSYDGLGLAKEEGDWGLIELEEGGWGHWRRYFSFRGELKGGIYNINTPVEFYPGFARYVDLEVDVVLIDKEAKIIDVEKIEKETRRGTISPHLKEKVLRMAEGVVGKLSLKG